MPKRTFPRKGPNCGDWVLIVIAFVGTGIGAMFSTFYFIPGIPGKVLGVLLGCLIVIWGIRLATKQYKGKGTMHAISRTAASPDLDNTNKREYRYKSADNQSLSIISKH